MINLVIVMNIQVLVTLENEIPCVLIRDGFTINVQGGNVDLRNLRNILEKWVKNYCSIAVSESNSLFFSITDFATTGVRVSSHPPLLLYTSAPGTYWIR